MVASPSAAGVTWALLAYRVPREPSTPRIAIWRRLKRLGVAQLGDGLVALPADARTTEALDWVAGDALAAGGSATLWSAQLISRAAERQVISDLAGARAKEYTDLARLAEAAGASAVGPMEASRVLRSLRRRLREIQRRDHFPPPERQRAQLALRSLTDQVLGTTAPTATNRAAETKVRSS